MWNPNIIVKDNNDTIDGLDRIDEKKFNQICGICKGKNGVCIPCGKSTCSEVFHVECGRLAGLFMEITQGKFQDLVYKMYCKKHRPLKLMREIEQNRKKSLDEVYNFCKIVNRCTQILSGPQNSHKKRFTTPRPKTFSKQDQAKLLSRIHQICTQINLLTIEFEKPNENCENYKISEMYNEPYYAQTLDKNFPWNLIAFNKFSEQDCFNEYMRLIPNEYYFSSRVLKREPTWVPKKSLKLLTPEVYTDPTKFCSCQKTYLEDSSPMIGIFLVNNLVECAGGKECKNNGWMHIKCIGGISVDERELRKIMYYCPDCRNSLKLA